MTDATVFDKHDIIIRHACVLARKMHNYIQVREYARSAAVGEKRFRKTISMYKTLRRLPAAVVDVDVGVNFTSFAVLSGKNS